MATARQSLVALAQICEKAGLYVKMVEVMKTLVNSVKGINKLDQEERNLLTIAYKNYIGPRRGSWRTILNIEKAEEVQTSNRRYELAKNYRKKIGKDLIDKCKELISLLETKLIPKVKEPESDIFYHKLKGDYCRYIAETEIDNKDIANGFIDKANESYQGASEYASKSLAATHPLRLSLALNYSVFLHELRQDYAGAIEVANATYDDAMKEIDQVRAVDETKYRESTDLMRLIRANVRIWSSTGPTGQQTNQF